MGLARINRDMSQRYEGGIGFGDIRGGSLEQFRMEDKTTSDNKMLGPRIGKQVLKAHELAPELFDVQYGERLHPALSFAQQTQNQAAEGAVWNNRSDIYFDHVEELKQRFPDAGFMDMDEIYKDSGQEILAGREAQARREKHATPMARALGSIAGTAQGALEDPVNILSMLVFKTPATTLLGKAAFTGGVAMTSETAIQPVVYDFKQKAGLDYSLTDALANIAMAGLGGALLEGVGHGISKAYKAAVKRGEIVETPQTKAAVEKIEELQEIVDEVAVEDVSRLDMSTEARMQRAKDMGFDTETVYYHGTGNLSDLKAFDPMLTGQGNDQYGSGFYFTNSQSVASGYATSRIQADTPKLGGEGSPGVIRAYLAVRNPIKMPEDASNLRQAGINLTAEQVRKMLEHSKALKRGADDENMNPLGDHYASFWDSGAESWMLDDLSERYSGEKIENIIELFDEDYTSFREALNEVTGYDGVEINFSSGETHKVAWFPDQIRSVNAAFNPEQAGSAKLIDTPELNNRLQGLAKAEADLKAGRPVQGDETIQAIDEPTAANWDEYQQQNKGTPATFKQGEQAKVTQQPEVTEKPKDEVELDIAEAEALIADDQDLPDIQDIDQYGNEVMVPAKVAMTKADREINAIDSLLDCIK